MMKWGTEILSSANCISKSNLLFGESKTGNWTLEENKKFEDALATYDSGTPHRWKCVAAMIPSKSEADVLRHYEDLVGDVRNIEAGFIPLPGYGASHFALECVSNRDLEGLKSLYPVGVGKRSTARADQERKKGVPWTEEEHRQFLKGLKKYGKGDWRNISREFVYSRTPSQVASHAQKYYIRQGSVGKDKRRSSIHDITTINIIDSRPPSPSQSTNIPVGATTVAEFRASDSEHSILYDPDQLKVGATHFSPASLQAHGSVFNSSPFGLTSHGMKLQTQNFQRGFFDESQVFQLQRPNQHHYGWGDEVFLM